MSDQIKEGQEVSWNWGGGQPTGKVAEVVEEVKAEIKTKKGNTVSRNAKDGDPAVKVARDGNDVVKLAHELNETE